MLHIAVKTEFAKEIFVYDFYQNLYISIFKNIWRYPKRNIKLRYGMILLNFFRNLITSTYTDFQNLQKLRKHRYGKLGNIFLRELTSMFLRTDYKVINIKVGFLLRNRFFNISVS